jgi:hypothetical protein
MKRPNIKYTRDFQKALVDFFGIEEGAVLEIHADPQTLEIVMMAGLGMEGAGKVTHEYPLYDEEKPQAARERVVAEPEDDKTLGEQALALREQGWTYVSIAKKLNLKNSHEAYQMVYFARSPKPDDENGGNITGVMEPRNPSPSSPSTGSTTNVSKFFFTASQDVYEDHTWEQRTEWSDTSITLTAGMPIHAGDPCVVGMDGKVYVR